MLDMSSLNQLCIETGFQIARWPSQSSVKTVYFFGQQRCNGDMQRFKREVVGDLLSCSGGIVLKNAYKHFPSVYPEADNKELSQMRKLYVGIYFAYNPEKNKMVPVQKLITQEAEFRLVQDCEEAILCLISAHSPNLLLNYLFMDIETKAEVIRDILKISITQVAEHAQLKEKMLDYIYDFVLMNRSLC